MYGGGRVFARGRRWWIAFFHRGVEYREPTEARTKREAGNVLRDKLGALGTGQAVPARKLTVADLVKAYLTSLAIQGRKSAKSAKSCAQPIIDDLGAERAVELTSSRIDAYVAEVLAKPARRGKNPPGPGTINRRLGILRAAFRLAVKQGRIARVPHVTMLAEPAPRQGFLELADFEAVVVELPEYLRDAARFAYVTGWRKSEVLGLRWEQVDRAGGEVRLATSKNSLPRSLPLLGDVPGLDGTKEIIERRWEARTVELEDDTTAIAEHVFHHHGRPLRFFRTAWGKACERAGHAGQLFHDLRRSGVRNMVRAGVPESVAMSISGHKTAAVFRRYDIVSQEDKTTALRQTLARLAAKREAPSVTPIGKRGSR